MTDFSKVTAGEIMKRNLITARPDQEATELERLLIDKNISGVPVVEKGRLLGIVSRSDITRVQVMGDALDSQIRDELHWDERQGDGFKKPEGEQFEMFQDRLKRFKVRDLMRSQVVTCTASTSVSQLAGLMGKNHIHRVVVVDGEQPIGIVSSLDIVKLVAQAG